jgi:hypothetical protein
MKERATLGSTLFGLPGNPDYQGPDYRGNTVVSTRIGKPSLIFSGYQYRTHRKNSKLVIWVCVKDKCGKCKGELKSTLQYEIFSKTP